MKKKKRKQTATKDRRQDEVLRLGAMWALYPSAFLRFLESLQEKTATPVMVLYNPHT